MGGQRSEVSAAQGEDSSRQRFIVLEGGEGAGKSRLQAALAERLGAKGGDVVVTREPGGTELGERIRAILLDQRGLEDPLAELLLFEVARAHLVASVIRPALERGAVVLCDRFTASSIAYQGYARGLGHDVVERANAIATGGVEPDLVLLLDVPVDVGLSRRVGDGGSNHFEREAVAFHQRVRDAYLALARESPDRWRVIDATLPFEEVVEAAMGAIRSTHSV